MNLLDERVHHAESNYQVRDPRAPDDITTLRSVGCRHATYYAVVRNATVVTVLDEEMARNNFGSQWTPILNAPFEALRGLKIPPPPVPVLPAAATETTPPADQLAEAGVAYARARKQKHACTEAVTQLRAELEHATEDLRAAELAVDETHQRLIDLTDGGELP